MSYKVVFQTFDPGKAEIIYDDRSLTIETIPLRHRIPTCGVLDVYKRQPLNLQLFISMVQDVVPKRRI